MQDESVDESVDKAVKAIRKVDPYGWTLPRMPSEEAEIEEMGKRRPSGFWRRKWYDE